MPRGRPRVPRGTGLDAGALQSELDALKKRSSEIRGALRRLKNSASGIRKLEQKLEKQLGTAKWTVQQIHELDPNYNDTAFYAKVKARQPAPRGRRRRTPAEA